MVRAWGSWRGAAVVREVWDSYALRLGIRANSFWLFWSKQYKCSLRKRLLTGRQERGEGEFPTGLAGPEGQVGGGSGQVGEHSWSLNPLLRSQALANPSHKVLLPLSKL